MLSEAKKKFVRNYRDYGFAPAVEKAFKHLFQFIYYSKDYRIYRKHLEENSTPVDCRDGLTFAVVGTRDSEIIRQIETMEEWLAGKVDGMLGSGAVCVAVVDDGRVAGFNIASFGDIQMPIVRTTRKMRPDEAWSEQITVSRDYRGKGLATVLRRKMFAVLGEREVRKFYGGTLTSNRANLALSRKVGFEEIADIRYRKLLNLQRWQVRRVRKDS